MSYPLIIKDDFFEDPDSIVKIIKEVDYHVFQHNYPGVRSNQLNLKLLVYISQKIFLLFHDKTPDVYNMNMRFHKINPFVKGDKWDRKNLGGVHKDACLFGGLIYMDKNPDKDAGTGIYKPIDGVDVQTKESMDAKELFYSGKPIDDKHYYNSYDSVRNQYEETLRIPNVYNRLVLIPGNQLHAMTTTGNKERNTIVFFCSDVSGVYPPEYKVIPTVPISNYEFNT